MSLTLYKPLGSNDEKTRLEAAKSLVTELSAKLNGEKDEKSSNEVQYALKRLTRGLSSGRESSRIGFSLVLTEFLSQLLEPSMAEKWEVSVETVLESIVKNTKAEGGASAQEERGSYFGQLFGFKSVIQSKRISTTSQWESILDALFGLGLKKSWLREPCAAVIRDSATKFPEDLASEWTTVTYTKLIASGTAKSSEGIAIWLVLQETSPSVQPPSGVWKNENPLNDSNLGTLAKVLKESKVEDAGAEKAVQQKGSWNQKLPIVWSLILQLYAKSAIDKVERKGMAPFEAFWRVAVDENLFAASASDEKKFWGFQLVTEVLSICDLHKIDLHRHIFSRNFVRCLINQLSKEDRYLHKMAEKTIRSVSSFGTKNPSEVLFLVESLVSNNGSPNFDNITKTKTVEKLLPQADTDGLLKIVKLFDGIILAPKEEEKRAIELRRQWAADHLLSLIRSGTTDKTEKWVGQVLHMFATYGHFDVSEAKPSLSPETQTMFRSRLLSCLSALVGGVEREDGEAWPYVATKRIAKLRKEGKYKFAIELDDEIQSSIDKAYKQLDKIRKKRQASSGLKKDQMSAFELLFTLVILQVFNGDSESLGLLDELKFVYDKIVRAKGGDDEEDGPDAGNLLVEILLSLLSKQSSLLRKLAQQVFKAFTKQLTAENLQLMFDVLDTDENADGQNELFERDDDNEDDDEDSEDDDVEEIEKMDVDGADEDGSGSDSDSDVEVLDESDEDMDDEEADKLNAAIANALKTDIGDSGRESSDDDMDDDEMMAVDEHLVNIFKARKQTTSKKKERREAAEAMKQFKSRILEILDVYVKQENHNPLALDVLLPLLRLIRRTSTKQISEKAVGVIRTLFKAKGVPAISDKKSAREAAWEILESIHNELLLDGSAAHTGACSQASLLTAKVLVAGGHNDKKTLSRIFNLYAKTMSEWMFVKQAAQPSFFTEMVNWANSTRNNMKPVAK
ncbi:DNA polymerase V [Ascobolus immersus RN42]|uniref:DNA polymerase V n=1 Tax=Ascobolus immersus RN42 TaxID=1160509 RepID=A0A3N4I280_ASCIM|nr:DNA polymerase V [Ascobolus immersus RN42]